MSGKATEFQEHFCLFQASQAVFTLVNLTGFLQGSSIRKYSQFGQRDVCDIGVKYT